MLGHRGARHAAPENTLCAFELARTEGADGIELDVRLDANGAVIVLHDPTLERVTRGTERRHSESLSSAELSRCDVGDGERVPSLVEVLSWAKRYELRVNVELKSDVRARRSLLEGVKRVLESTPLPPVILSSFDPHFVFWLTRNVPNLPSAWLVHARQRLLKYAPGYRFLGASALHPEHTLASAERVRRIHARGGVLNVWTVNDPARATELAKIGVDAIISDNPALILQALGG